MDSSMCVTNKTFGGKNFIENLDWKALHAVHCEAVQSPSLEQSCNSFSLVAWSDSEYVLALLVSQNEVMVLLDQSPCKDSYKHINKTRGKSLRSETVCKR